MLPKISIAPFKLEKYLLKEQCIFKASRFFCPSQFSQTAQFGMLKKCLLKSQAKPKPSFP